MSIGNPLGTPPLHHSFAGFFMCLPRSVSTYSMISHTALLSAGSEPWEFERGDACIIEKGSVGASVSERSGTRQSMKLAEEIGTVG